MNSLDKLDQDQIRALGKVLGKDQIEDNLRLFVCLVDRGETPPRWLMEFVAQGAREFLKGGKPWQKGKGGRPPAEFGQKELEAHILHCHGGLSHSDIVALRDYPDDGKDYTKTIGREIERGGLALFLAKARKLDFLIDTYTNLAESRFDALSPNQEKKCRAGLKHEIQRLREEVAERESR